MLEGLLQPMHLVMFAVVAVPIFIFGRFIWKAGNRKG
jgi:hypothetical protein